MVTAGSGVLPRLLVGRAERTVRNLLESADVRVGGSRPHDIQVHDRRFYLRVLRDGRLGLGESYMDGQWDAGALDELTAMLIRAGVKRPLPSWRGAVHLAAAGVWNLQNAVRSLRAVEHHYDLGNDLYRAMLGETLVYTCAYWKNARTLDEAQRAKLDLVCRKLELRPGMKVLELGCGWGTFARHAAERYGVEVTGYTVSREQLALGTELCRGLPITLHLADYRTARGRYDAVVSIGLMEHVGPRNHRVYMETVDRCLRPGGVAFIHTIGSNRSQVLIDPWFHRYVFPNAAIPSLAQVTAAMEGMFVPEDVHNIGPHYDRTLMAWAGNFDEAWPGLRARLGERFRRMWRYYLLSSAGAFRARFLQLYQMVMTRPGTAQPRCRMS
ncbi:MAG TPA: cyclopropane fatty acyl phospholipid synthase [Myxococcaceae bacterium]|nr:cyclopropane fatty acyl phospholipid synthase [Myxococcaceae bacterium]